MPDTSTSSAAAPSPSITPDQATDKLAAMLSPSMLRQAQQGKPADDGKEWPAPDPGARDGPDPSTGSGPAAGEPEEPEEHPEEVTEEPEVEPVEADREGPAAEEFLFTVNLDGREIQVPMRDVMIPVKLDGKAIPLPVGEVRDGYMRRADYTQKTQAHSHQVQAFAEHVQQVTQERQVYGVLIGALEEQLKSSMPQEPNWQQLLAHPDKSVYWTARANWDETQRRLTAIAEEKDRLGELQNMETEQKLNQHLSQARTWLTEQLPAWRDENRATADKAKLREYALANGFTQFDVDHAYDPRLVILAHKARLYDELVKNRPRPAIGASPEALKPGIATHEPATISAKLTKAKNRLRQTGRPEDATAAIELILQRGH